MLLLAALLPLLAWNGVVQQINLAAYDVLLNLQPPARTSTIDRIVLLAIDDATVARSGGLPIRRDLLAAGLQRLALAPPRVLVVDMLFPEESEYDQSLTEVLTPLPGVVLGAALSTDRSAATWLLPRLRVPRAALGHVHSSPDADGVVRSMVLRKSNNAERHWALALEAVRLAEGAGSVVESRERLTLGGITVPARAAQDYLLWLRYAGPPETFRTYSFNDLLDGKIGPQAFAGKIVILGGTAYGSGDRLFTPTTRGLGMPGMEIHANLVRVLLDRDFLRPLDAEWEYGVLLTLGGLVFAFAWWKQGRGVGWLMGSGAVALPVIAIIALGRGWIVPLGALLAAFLTASLMALVTTAALTRRRAGQAEAGQRDYAFRLQAIAHEIKTPLTAIQASSELMSIEGVPPEKKEAVAALIHKESKRLAGIVGAFLNVERISAGMLQLNRQPVDLAEVCREAVERAQLLAARKSIAIESDLPPVSISGDGELLAFAVYNLLTNAVKYSPVGAAVRVTLRAEGTGARLEVVDQGLGIEPAEQQRIFERFYRLKRDEAGAQPGSGLGLALVREIVTQHGGRVEVESAPGRGSRFTLVLP